MHSLGCVVHSASWKISQFVHMPRVRKRHDNALQKSQWSIQVTQLHRACKAVWRYGSLWWKVQHVMSVYRTCRYIGPSLKKGALLTRNSRQTWEFLVTCLCMISSQWTKTVSQTSFFMRGVGQYNLLPILEVGAFASCLFHPLQMWNYDFSCKVTDSTNDSYCLATWMYKV